MKTLKVIPSTLLKETKVLNSTNSIESEFWYLHGNLQDLVNTDRSVLLITNDIIPCIRNINSESCLYINGMVDVDIIGLEEPCTGFFWTIDLSDGRWIQRGLIVLNSDEKWYNDAKEKYAKRVRVL